MDSLLKLLVSGLVFGMPAVGALIAFVPYGVHYVWSSVAFIAGLFIFVEVAMVDADGPDGFGMAIYMTLVMLAFLIAHGIKAIGTLMSHLQTPEAAEPFDDQKRPSPQTSREP